MYRIQLGRFADLAATFELAATATATVTATARLPRHHALK